MQRLRVALEQLDDMISVLEDKVGINAAAQREFHRKQIEQLKQSRAREAGVIAVAQKVAARLDQTIAHVEKCLGE